MRLHPWLIIPRLMPGARVRLICLPHAGAGASTYFPWGPPLQAAGIEVRAVQYPGRETRLAESLISDAPAMVRQLADAWEGLAGDGPTALFGHSMGGLLAFELARELIWRGAANLPQRLFLSGRNPPHAPRRMPRLLELPDRAFLEAIAAHYGGVPAQLLEHPEMVELFAPVLRSDFTLVDAYAPLEIDPVDLPLTIFGGDSDPWTTEAELAEWARHSRRPLTLRVFAGDHFFHQKLKGEVIAAIVADLACAPACL